MDAEKENNNAGYESEGTDNDAPIVEYFLSRGPYVQPGYPIPEDWVQGRVAVPLAQLSSGRSTQVRMVNAEEVKLLEDCFLKYGYHDTRNTVTVRALPRNRVSEVLVPPEQVYEVLDGHHRVAALRALQARNLLPREYALPVTVLRDAVPHDLILAFQGFANRPVGHTHECVDELFARLLENE